MKMSLAGCAVRKDSGLQWACQQEQHLLRFLLKCCSLPKIRRACLVNTGGAMRTENLLRVPWPHQQVQSDLTVATRAAPGLHTSKPAFARCASGRVLAALPLFFTHDDSVPPGMSSDMMRKLSGGWMAAPRKGTMFGCRTYKPHVRTQH